MEDLETQVLAVRHDDGPGDDRRPPPVVRAEAVSTAVLELLEGPRALRVRGGGRGVVHLDLDGTVVTVAAPRVPRMPNAIVAHAPSPPFAVAWDPEDPPAWNPVVPPLAGGRAEVRALEAWLAERVRARTIDLSRAGERLLGRGPGLTPEGDDLLGGAAVAVRALGPAAGLAPDAVERLVRTLCPADARDRTGALSATLLALAARGAAPEPVHRLIGGRDPEAALADLRRLGASTGAAIAEGIRIAAGYLVQTTG
jgi:hypothetical protein